MYLSLRLIISDSYILFAYHVSLNLHLTNSRRRECHVFDSVQVSLTRVFNKPKDNAIISENEVPTNTPCTVLELQFPHTVDFSGNIGK